MEGTEGTVIRIVAYEEKAWPQGAGSGVTLTETEGSVHFSNGLFLTFPPEDAPQVMEELRDAATQLELAIARV